MKNQALIRRYTQGLVNAIEDDEEYTALYDELTAFAKLLEDRSRVREALASRFLPLKKKMELAGEITRSIGFQDKTVRFLLLLIENGRLPLFEEILDFLPGQWNESRGITTMDVISVVPLTENQKTKLESALEKLEKRPVSLKYAIDPELLGGLAIRKQNIVFDVSLKGELERLKETLSEG